MLYFNKYGESTDEIIMNQNGIKIDIIKSILSTLSMAVLAIQHFVGLFAKGISVSYIPLTITFLTIFLATVETKEAKGIRRVSLIASVVMALVGCIIYTIVTYGIVIDTNIQQIYIKIMFGFIGVMSLILSILYIKRITEIK